MPQTLRLSADRPADVLRAASILRAGGLVAFPTETVYGLGANALSAEAVRGIFAAKQRPSWDPLIVHVTELSGVERVACIEDAGLWRRVERFAEAFWPGPLTMLLPKAAAVPDEVTAGRALVGVRIPAHAVPRALLRAAGVPVAAPSANRFGHVSPTTAQHVLDDLDGRIDAVLDGGPTAVGVESTVLDPAGKPMMLYRSGAVTRQALEEALGIPVELFEPVPKELAEPASLPSPGVGIRHYAPEARVVLTGPDPVALNEGVRRALEEQGGLAGVLLPHRWELGPDARLVLQPWGDWSDRAALAAGLFGGLRALEARGVRVIVCPLPEPGGLGDALRDRLLKAARPR